MHMCADSPASTQKTGRQCISANSILARTEVISFEFLIASLFYRYGARRRSALLLLLPCRGWRGWKEGLLLSPSSATPRIAVFFLPLRRNSHAPARPPGHDGVQQCKLSSSSGRGM